MFSAEDALRAAMAQACEKAQQAGMHSIAKLLIRPFDVQDALRLLSVLNSVSNATKKVELAVEIEAKDGSNVQIAFRGSIAEALPLKDYLEPRIRAAQDNDVQCKYEITFDPVLPLAGDAVSKLIERVTRLAPGAAEVVVLGSKG